MFIRSLVLLALLPLSTAHAGVSVQYDSTGSVIPNSAKGGTILIDKHRSRMDVGTNASVIFDGNAQSMEIISHDDKTYTVLDKASAEAIAAELEPALQQMRTQLQALPPEQREMMEKMMAERMGINLQGAAEQEPDLDLKKTDKSGESGGIACNWWQATDDTVLRYEYCVTPAKSVPYGDDLLKYFHDLKQFKREIVGTINRSGALQIPSLPIADVREIEGLPLISRQYQDGKLILETRFVSVTETDVPAATFTLPEGYSEQKLPGVAR